MNLKERAKKLKSDIPAVFLTLKDKDTPILVKIMASITVAYALSPIDLIPDFIPVLGYLDDVILLPAFIAFTIKLVPKEIWEKNRKKAEHLWDNGKPKKWYYAIPIIAIWFLIVWLIIKHLSF
ncbi:YkvA family protein [Intestinibacter sp.]